MEKIETPEKIYDVRIITDNSIGFTGYGPQRSLYTIEKARESMNNLSCDGVRTSADIFKVKSAKQAIESAISISDQIKKIGEDTGIQLNVVGIVCSTNSSRLEYGVMCESNTIVQYLPGSHSGITIFCPGSTDWIKATEELDLETSFYKYKSMCGVVIECMTVQRKRIDLPIFLTRGDLVFCRGVHYFVFVDGHGSLDKIFEDVSLNYFEAVSSLKYGGCFVAVWRDFEKAKRYISRVSSLSCKVLCIKSCDVMYDSESESFISRNMRILDSYILSTVAGAGRLGVIYYGFSLGDKNFSTGFDVSQPISNWPIFSFFSEEDSTSIEERRILDTIDMAAENFEISAFLEVILKILKPELADRLL